MASCFQPFQGQREFRLDNLLPSWHSCPVATVLVPFSLTSLTLSIDFSIPGKGSRSPGQLSSVCKNTGPLPPLRWEQIHYKHLSALSPAGSHCAPNKGGGSSGIALFESCSPTFIPSHSLGIIQQLCDASSRV